jgi:hypothetical protein
MSHQHPAQKDFFKMVLSINTKIPFYRLASGTELSRARMILFVAA